MEKIAKLNYWAMDTIEQFDCCDHRSELDCTRHNIKYIVDEHNKLVDVVNNLLIAKGHALTGQCDDCDDDE